MQLRGLLLTAVQMNGDSKHLWIVENMINLENLQSNLTDSDKQRPNNVAQQLLNLVM